MIRKEWLVLSGVVLLSILLLVVPFNSGCAPQVTEEKYVTALNLADLTGPTAALAVPIDKAAKAYFDSLNEKGGINGIKVNYIAVDTRYDTARTVASYKRNVTKPKLLFVLPPSTAAVKALAPMMQADKTVGWGPPDGEFQAFPGRYFLMGPAFQDGFSAMIDWVVADWKAKGMPGMPKLGHMSWDNPYGREPLHGGKEYAEKIGVTLLPPEFFPTGSLKHDVYLTRLANAGANYIHVGGVEVTPINVIQDAYALGLTKDIQFITDYFGPNEVTGVRERPEVMEDTVIYSFYLRGEEGREHPLSELWVSYGYGDLVDMPDTFLLGINVALSFEAGVRRALEYVDYEELDGDDMLHAWENLTGEDINNGLTGPCTWSETDRRESRMIKFYRFKSGAAVPITEWKETPDAVSLYEW